MGHSFQSFGILCYAKGYHFCVPVCALIHEGARILSDHAEKKAYHCFVQVGLIAQGMLQYLSMTQTEHVWKHFGSWIRTIRLGILPSEAIVSKALWNMLPYFLKGSITGEIIEKFITSRIDRKRSESMRFAG